MDATSHVDVRSADGVYGTLSWHDGPCRTTWAVTDEKGHATPAYGEPQDAIRYWRLHDAEGMKAE